MASSDDTRNPVEDRRQSAETFADGLADIDQPVNDQYRTDTMEIDDVEIAPFWFTKGMPLATDSTGARYVEGIVPFDDKRANYFERVAEERFTGEEAFERGGERLFIGPPDANSVPLAGMDSHQGRMPAAPDPTGRVTAAEMIDAYAMEQLRDVPFTAWPNEPTGPQGADRKSVEAILEDRDDSDPLVRTIEALQEDLDRARTACDSPPCSAER
jgi:hypothetical protein